MATPGPALGRHPDREANHGGAGLVLAGAAALAAYLYWRDHHGAASSGACGPMTGQAASLPTGLYVTYFDNAKTVGTIWWVVQGVGRWGVPSQTQLARCFGPNPTVIDASTVGGFGNADSPSNDYIGTLGYISACTACPPGA